MMIKEEKELADLVKAFEERTLMKSEWTHAAHLLVGMHYCLNHSFGIAKNLMRDGIYWLNDAHGTPNTKTSGYHETMTMFWLAEISEFLSENSAETNLVDLANKLLEELDDSKLPFRFYSRELIFSSKARETIVEPDLHPQDLSRRQIAGLDYQVA